VPSYGQIQKNVKQQRSASSIEEAEFYASRWCDSLEAFESCTPTNRFEQVQWLRALGKVGSEFGAPRTRGEALGRRDLRELCRLNMVALYAGLPDAAAGLRELARATPQLVPSRISAHLIADRLLDSLGPRRK
jgi:hypothetical protein